MIINQDNVTKCLESLFTGRNVYIKLLLDVGNNNYVSIFDVEDANTRNRWLTFFDQEAINTGRIFHLRCLDEADANVMVKIITN